MRSIKIFRPIANLTNSIPRRLLGEDGHHRRGEDYYEQGWQKKYDHRNGELSWQGGRLFLRARHSHVSLFLRQNLQRDTHRRAVPVGLVQGSGAGDIDKGITTLRKLAKSENTTSLVRQNLALLYGIKGDMEEAKRLAKQDLPQDAVDQNLSTYRDFRE